VGDGRGAARAGVLFLSAGGTRNTRNCVALVELGDLEKYYARVRCAALILLMGGSLH